MAQPWPFFFLATFLAAFFFFLAMELAPCHEHPNTHLTANSSGALREELADISLCIRQLALVERTSMGEL
jgi:hypothetical protein